MRIFEGKDDLLAMLQRDKDFYEGQDRKMRMKVTHLCRQLDEAQIEALKYKRLMEEINGNKYKPNEVMRIADQLGISAATDDQYPDYFLAPRGKHGVDSSMEADLNSMTDSSSYVSNDDSSFSLDSKGGRSFSNDLRRQSFDSTSGDLQAYVSDSRLQC